MADAAGKQMTPKQKYDERKRLRAERLLREEQDYADRQAKMDAREAQGMALIDRALDCMERIADALELWADLQKDTPHD